ncbi:hypothetical protein ACFOUO_01055 [Salinithrix halophila]|uniref:Uncharacterized protein n=1 Tax=Salinithrix halophila TaxID=1485204 RepID=A0ABV8JAL6_9BACL
MESRTKPPSPGALPGVRDALSRGVLQADRPVLLNSRRDEA